MPHSESLSNQYQFYRGYSHGRFYRPLRPTLPHGDALFFYLLGYFVGAVDRLGASFAGVRDGELAILPVSHPPKWSRSRSHKTVAIWTAVGPPQGVDVTVLNENTLLVAATRESKGGIPAGIWSMSFSQNTANATFRAASDLEGISQSVCQ